MPFLLLAAVGASAACGSDDLTTTGQETPTPEVEQFPSPPSGAEIPMSGVSAAVRDDAALILVSTGAAIQALGILTRDGQMQAVDPVAPVSAPTPVATGDGFAVAGFECLQRPEPSDDPEGDECLESRAVATFLSVDGTVESVSAAEPRSPGARAGDPSVPTPDGVIVLGERPVQISQSGTITEIERPTNLFICGANAQGSVLAYRDGSASGATDPSVLAEEELAARQVEPLVYSGDQFEPAGPPVLTGGAEGRSRADFPRCVVGGAIAAGNGFSDSSGWRQIDGLTPELFEDAVGFASDGAVVVANGELLVLNANGAQDLGSARVGQAWPSLDGSTALVVSNEPVEFSFVDLTR